MENVNPNPPISHIPLITLITLLVLSLSLSAFLGYQNLQLQKKITKLNIQSISIPPAEDELTKNWETYTDKVFKFRYPKDLLTVEPDDEQIIIRSPFSSECMTSVSGSVEAIYLYNIDMTMQIKNGKSYNDVWKDSFGFEFNEKKSDGKVTIGGKVAHFFIQSAESPTYRKSLFS